MYSVLAVLGRGARLERLERRLVLCVAVWEEGAVVWGSVVGVVAIVCVIVIKTFVRRFGESTWNRNEIFEMFSASYHGTTYDLSAVDSVNIIMSFLSVYSHHTLEYLYRLFAVAKAFGVALQTHLMIMGMNI